MIVFVYQCLSDIEGEAKLFSMLPHIFLSCYQHLSRWSSSFYILVYPVSNWKKKNIVKAFNLI